MDAAQSISGKLLIVDDFADIRILLEAAFKNAGHDVTTAADVRGAKEELEEQDFDVVVTDLDLPDSNGIELTNWIRQRGSDAEVIVITGHASMNTVSEALRLGAFDYLTKPFEDLSLVVRCVERALEKQSLTRALNEKVIKLENEIRERQRVEEDLAVAIQKAEDAVIAKSQFLANMSHEIRTPMNGVIGMTDLLLRTPLDERQRRYVETVRRSGDALLTIIGDILDFSKIEAGKLILHEVDFDLQRTISDVCELLQGQAWAGGVELEQSIDSDLQTTLIGDPGRIRQILTNLVGNAIKFTEEGTVSVCASLIEKSETHQKFRLSVKDTGVGISKENQQKLFKTFSQVDDSFTRKHEGTGLGLAISKELTSLMGGKIGVDSEIGSGSTFWFELDLQLQNHIALSTDDTHNSLRGLRILWVDSNQTERPLRDLQATVWGCRIEVVESGQQALASLELASSSGAPFHVVVSDLRLPGIDGFELGRRVLASNVPRPHMALVTSFAQRGDASTAMECGYRCYIPKPATDLELYDAFLDLINQDPDAPSLVTRHSVAERQAEENNRSKTVLIAEDNIVNQEVTKELLSELGFTAVVAEDGVEAFDMRLSQDFGLILMDCHMPNKNGFEATQAIRIEEEQQGLSRIPIVALTAAAMAGDKEKALESGMDDYLAKPVTSTTLGTTLEQWYRGQASRPLLPSEQPPRIPNSTSEFEEWRKMLVDVADTLAEASQFLDEDNALALAERIHRGLGRLDENLVPGLTRPLRDLMAFAASTRLDLAVDCILSIRERLAEHAAAAERA